MQTNVCSNPNICSNPDVCSQGEDSADEMWDQGMSKPWGDTSLFVSYRFYIVYRQSPLGPVDPSFRALSGRLKFMVRRHKFNKDSLFSLRARTPPTRCGTRA